MSDNDNSFPVREATLGSSNDAHGRPASLLVESLIHELCEKSTLSNAEAVEVADRAISVQADQAEAADGAGAPHWRSHALLSSIAASLEIDADRSPVKPRLVS